MKVSTSNKSKKVIQIYNEWFFSEALCHINTTEDETYTDATNTLWFEDDLRELFFKLVS
jgi:hypothetical protein